MSAARGADLPLDPPPSDAPSITRALEVAALGCGLVAAATAMAALGDWRAALGRFQTIYLLAFVPFAIAVARLPRWERLPHASLVVLAVAIAARGALLATPPSLSDDVYRYLWEGRVLLAGENPWARAPADPALAPLRDALIHPRINHPELSAIYPPLGAIGYAVVAAISPTVIAAKIWVVLHELAAIVLLMVWLRRRGAPAARALVFAWCPLMLIEFAGSGHNDATAMPWLVLSLMLAERRPVGSAVALAVGAMVKLVPLLALPALWRVWNGRARATAALTIGVGLAGYLALTQGTHSGLAAFGTRWRNNELGFGVLERFAGGELAARAIAATLVAIAIAWGVWRRLEPWRATQLALRTALLASPVVHPWYLAWNLVLEPWSRSAPWLLLSCTAILNYGVFRTPAAGRDFHLPLAGRAIEYGLPLALALALGWRARRRARP